MYNPTQRVTARTEIEATMPPMWLRSNAVTVAAETECDLLDVIQCEDAGCVILQLEDGDYFELE